MAKNLVVRFIGDTTPLAAAITGLQTHMRARLGPGGMAAAGVIGAAAGGLALIGNEFDKAFDTIRTGTGATGENLEGLQESFKNAVSEVPADFGDAATAIADVNTRLGLTGQPLEDLTTQFLELSRITGTDIASNIATVTRVFGDWGIAAEDQSDTLDELFRASQNTGVGVDTLSERIVQFGAPLRNLGFEFEEATALIGSFEKNGVNLETVMGGLRIGIGKLAREGEDVPETFRRVIAEIEGAGSASEATGIAMELFGQRAGADLADAIQNGQFAIEDMLGAITDGEDTIRSAGEETMSMGEQFTLVKNRVFVALEPIATDLFKAIGDVAEVVGILAQAFSRLPGPVRIAALAIGGLLLLLNLNPTFAFITAVITAATLIVKNWDSIVEFFREIPGRIVDGLEKFGEIIWEGIKAGFEFIKEKIEAVVDVYVGFYTALPSRIISTLSGFGSTVWNGIVSGFNFVRDKISAVVDLYVGFYTALPGRIVSALATIGETIWNGIIGSLGFLKDAFFLWLEGVKLLYWELPQKIISGLVDIGQTIWDGIVGSVLTIATNFGSFVSDIVGIFTGLPGRIVEMVTNGIGEVIDFFAGIGRDIVEAIIDGITNAPSIGQALADKIPGSGFDLGDLPGIPKIPGDPFRAHGGPVTRGQSYVVGEEGPELFVPGSSGTILPNAALASATGGGGDTIVVLKVGEREFGRWALGQIGAEARRNGGVHVRARVPGVAA